MKKIIAMLCALTLIGAASACFAAETAQYPILTGETGVYRAGVYEERVRGMGGWMVLHITFTADRLESIEVVSHTETPNIGTVALDNVIPAMIEAQNADVDVQAGATITSDALKEAVSKAIAEALAGTAAYVPGVYHERVRGMGGWMELDITFSETALEKIEVISHTETPNIGTVALEKVIPSMIEAQSADVDAQSGATITSEALKEAVTKAFREATPAK